MKRNLRDRYRRRKNPDAALDRARSVVARVGLSLATLLSSFGAAAAGERSASVPERHMAVAAIGSMPMMGRKLARQAFRRAASIAPSCDEGTASSSRISDLGPGFEIELESALYPVNQKVSVVLHVTRWGMPTRDLQAIFGQPACARIYDPKTGGVLWTYAHQLTATEIEVAEHAGHELDEIPGVDGIRLWDGASVIGDIAVRTIFPRPGTYRLVVELSSNGNKAYVPFDLSSGQ